jgi:hypothetical protein
MRIQELLFEPTLVRSPGRIVGWWERRRLTFNIAVGAIGVFAIAYTQLLGLLVGWPNQGPPLPLVVVYGVAANVCYTFGWISELLVERWLGRPVYGLGPALFRHGMVFSVGLTFLPVVLATFGAIGTLLFR